MPAILNGKSLFGGALNGKPLKAIYVGDASLHESVTDTDFAAISTVATAFNTSSVSGNFTATAGHDVFVIASCDRSGVPTSATYNGAAMTLLKAQGVNNGASIGGLAIFHAPGAGTGTSKAFAVTCPSGMLTAYAVSMSNTLGVGEITVAYGSGTSLSHSVVSRPRAKTLQGFTTAANGGGNNTLSSLSGGTNRGSGGGGGTYPPLVVNTAGTAALAATASASAPWCSIAIEVLSKPYKPGARKVWEQQQNPATYSNISAYAEGVSSATGSITAPAGADVFVIATCDRTGVPTVTLAGTSLTAVVTALHNNSATYGGIGIYRAAAAGTGSSQTFVATQSGGWVTAYAVAIQQVTAVGSTNTSYGQGTTLTHPALGNDGMILQAFSGGENGGSTYLIGGVSGATMRGQVKDTGNTMTVSTNTKPTVVTATCATSQRWAGVSVELRGLPALFVQPPPRVNVTRLGGTDIAVTATGGPGQFRNIIGYNFYRGGTKVSGSNPVAAQYTYTGLSYETEYTLTCKAVNPAGVESTAYPTVTVTTLPDTYMNSTDRSAIDTIVANIMAAHPTIPGITLSIDSPTKGQYQKAYGVANKSGPVPMAVNMHCRIASATKAFIAQLILREVSNNTLSLDDPISDYVDDITNGDTITIRDCLMMRAGIPEVQAIGMFAVLFALIPTWPSTLHDVWAIIKNQPAAFAPNTSFAYSNSNYMVLGQILEAVRGESVITTINDACTLLGLTDTYMPADETETGLREPHADGYGGPLDDLLGQPGASVCTTFNPMWFNTYGGIISTASDLQKWAGHMRDGTLLSPTVHAQWLADLYRYPLDTTGYPGVTNTTFGYGMGTWSMGNYMGHAGGMNGWASLPYFNPSSGDTIGLCQNTGGLEPLFYLLPQIMDYLDPGSAADYPYPWSPEH